ncbi:hypothetical protein [Mycolicibacterium grossiae]|uniref:hypothetical protein n=1 Tax=Mycolicibacterium grossiae TaxID=1552759 RepID=UPI001C408B1D|nr:hypothetical protein [Mycolicibacterium grossiae]
MDREKTRGQRQPDARREKDSEGGHGEDCDHYPRTDEVHTLGEPLRRRAKALSKRFMHQQYVSQFDK